MSLIWYPNFSHSFNKIFEAGAIKFVFLLLIIQSDKTSTSIFLATDRVLWITAMRDIKKDEELSYDYGFSFDCDYKDHICKCKSKNCVGFIVREGSRWRLKKIKDKKFI